MNQGRTEAGWSLDSHVIETVVSTKVKYCHGRPADEKSEVIGFGTPPMMHGGAGLAFPSPDPSAPIAAWSAAVTHQVRTAPARKIRYGA